MEFGKKNSAVGGSGEATAFRQIIRAGRPICVAGFAAVLTAAAGPAFAQGVVGGCSNGVCIVNVQDDPGASYVAGSGAADYTTGGPGTLSNAVNYANKNPGTKIILQTDVKLNGPLEVLLNSMTIDGQGHTIDGNKSQRIFMVGVDNVTLLNPQPGQPNLSPHQDVTISNVTLKDGFAKGGDGAVGAAGGGGGLGAGGALFVNQTGNVTLSNVNFSGNGAQGGNGGAVGGVGAGGGGGMGGNGGANWGGGGGIYGNGGAGVDVKGGGRGGGGGLIGDGGDSQLVNNVLIIAPGGGPNGGAPGGGFPPDGGDGGFASGGGGGTRGGNSFFGGGGGGGNTSAQGEGGGSGFGGGGGGGGGSGGTSLFGGGGGGAEVAAGEGAGTRIGGDGGFGGGGGAGADGGGLSGFGGGAGSVGNAPLAGGGGAGIGGSVFVVDGGKLSIAGSATGNAETNSSVAKGVGGNAGVNDGQAYTNGFFIQGGTTLNFTGGKFTVNGQIADLNGVSGNTNTNNGVLGAGGIGKVLSTGGAYATLMVDNLYTGGSTIQSASRIDVGANGSLGSGDLLMKDTSTLGFANNNLMISNDAVFEGDAAVDVQSGFTETIASKIVDGPSPGRLVKTGDGKLIVTGENTTTGGARLDAGILNIDVGTVKNAGGGIVSSGVGTGTLTFNGGTLQAGRNVEIANAGALNNAGGAFDANGQILTYSGNLTDGDGVNGQIKIVDSSGFNGKVIFNGDNSYNGETVVGDGVNLVTLEAGKDNTFSPTSKMTVKLAGTVDLAGFNETVSSLNGEGVVTNTGARDGVLTNQGASSEFKGQITDGPTNKTGLIQNQIGETLTLSGASTYSGGTKISGGAIQVGVQTVGVPGAITSSALGKGTLTFDSGTLRAGGDYTVANATTIDTTGGTVDANGKTFTLSGGITNGNGATGVLNIFDKSTNGGGTVVLINTNTYTGNTVVGDGTKAVTFKGGTANTFSANSQTTVNEKATLDLGSVAQTINAVTLNKGTLTSGTLTGAVTSDSGFINKLSGTATVTANTGTTTVSVTNDYTGDTTIKGGATLLGANDNALSQGSKTTVEANGKLDLGNFSQKVDKVTLTGGTLTNGALAGAVTSDSGLINKLSGTATVTANSGTTTLSVSNSYTGDTTIKGGATLTGATNDTLSKGSKTIVETNGTLQLASRTQTVDNVTLAGGLITTGTLTSTNGVTSDGGTINNLTINGGATSLTTTSGTTILTGTNSFKGDVINDADLINRGTTTDALINRRRFTNDPGAVYNADINNSTVNGVVTNNGTINGSLTNRLNATATNNAQWNGDITNETTATVTNALGATLDGRLTNSGVATNNGTILKGVTNNAGVTFTTTGVIQGGENNYGTTLASGSIGGVILNTGAFTVNGLLTGDSDTKSIFYNNTGGLLKVSSNYIGVGGVSNASTVEIDLGFGLNTVGAFVNNVGATTTNAGSLTTTLGAYNFSTDFQNLNGANIYGDVINGDGIVAARFNNAAGAGKGFGGTITGNVTNNFRSVFTNDGVVTGDFTNHGVLDAQNVISGVLTNTGTLNLTGTLDPTDTNNTGLTNLFSFTLISPVVNNNRLGVITSINGMVDGTLHNNFAAAIDLRTGLTPIANTLDVTGNYSGGGAMLISDTLTTGNGSQRGGQLLVAGAGTGNTGVYVSPVGPTSYYANPILVAKINQLGGRFLLANPGDINKGALRFRIEELAPGEWYLFPVLGTEVFKPVGSGIMATVTSQAGFFQGAAPFVTSPLSAKPNQPHVGLWIRSSVGRDDVWGHAWSSVGNELWSAQKMRTMYDGYQVGGDFAVWNVENTKFNLHAGVTGGQYFSNTYELKGSSTSATFRVPYVGVYGVLAGNGFFSDVMVRHDFWSASVNNQNAGLVDQGLHGHGWSGLANVGYRFTPFTNWFIEPSAGVHLNIAKFGDLPVVAGTAPAFLTFSRMRSTLGRAGFRIGTTYEVANMALQPYISLSAWREFEGDSWQYFRQESNVVPMFTTRVGTYGQVGAGLAAQIIGTDLVGFVRGDYRFGENISGGTLNGGLRYTF